MRTQQTLSPSEPKLLTLRRIAGDSRMPTPAALSLGKRILPLSGPFVIIFGEEVINDLSLFTNFVWLRHNSVITRMSILSPWQYCILSNVSLRVFQVPIVRFGNSFDQPSPGPGTRVSASFVEFVFPILFLIPSANPFPSPSEGRVADKRRFSSVI